MIPYRGWLCLLLACTGLFVSACSDYAQQCTIDADCPTRAYCHPRFKVCFHGDAGPGTATPVLTGTSPLRSGRTLHPTLQGTAEAGASIRIYLEMGCVGEARWTTTAGPNGQFEVDVAAADNATTTYFANARVGEQPSSGCSPGLSYTADTLPPVLLDFHPDAGAGRVAAGTELSLTFSEPVEPSSITAGSLSLRTGGAPVPIHTTSDGGVVRITPVEPLKSGTRYTVELLGGVQDLLGNERSEIRSWYFVTDARWSPATKVFETTSSQITTSSGPSGELHFALGYYDHLGHLRSADRWQTAIEQTIPLAGASPRLTFGPSAELAAFSHATGNTQVQGAFAAVDGGGALSPSTLPIDGGISLHGAVPVSSNSALISFRDNAQRLGVAEFRRDGGWSAGSLPPDLGTLTGCTKAVLRATRGGRVVEALTCANLVAYAYSPGSGWSSPTSIPGSFPVAFDPLIALQPDGSAFLFWKQSVLNGTEIWFSQYTPGAGSWSVANAVPQTVDANPVDAASGQYPGEVSLLFSRDAGTWLTNRREGTWQAPLPVADAGVARTFMNFDSSAEGVLVYAQSDPDANRFSVTGRRYSREHGLSAPETLASGPAEDASVMLLLFANSGLSVDENGSATFVWWWLTSTPGVFGAYVNTLH